MELSATFRLRTTKKGDKFALFRLEDEAGSTKCVLWPEVYRKHSALAQNELPAIVIGKLELSEDNPPTIIVDQLQSIDAAEKATSFWSCARRNTTTSRLCAIRF